jgi:hypothetical protein
MTDTYKAAPEQWKKAESWASGFSPFSACMLELRARVAKLEAQASNYPAIPDSSTPPPVATDEELDKIWNFEDTWKGGTRALYNLGVAHGQARSREVADPAPVAGGLVARVAYWITEDSDGPINCKNEARAAILELEKWLLEQGCDEAADLLKQEAWR